MLKKYRKIEDWNFRVKVSKIYKIKLVVNKKAFSPVGVNVRFSVGKHILAPAQEM